MILWTIRVATAFYVIALVQMILGRGARAAWTLGCAFYVAHVWAAFQYAYFWSHEIGVQETARQTEALFGVHWGGGIWFNYAFTAVWVADVVWWWMSAKSRERRVGWIDRVVHSYLAFLFLNGAIVFAHGAVRWVAAGAACGLLILFLWRRFFG